MKKIFENVTITHRNGEKQLYDAIQVAKKGVYTGHVIKKIEEQVEFEESGFIPRGQIQKITVCNEHGKLRDIDL